MTAKDYQNPSMTVLKVETESLLCVSGEFESYKDENVYDGSFTVSSI